MSLDDLQEERDAFRSRPKVIDDRHVTGSSPSLGNNTGVAAPVDSEKYPGSKVDVDAGFALSRGDSPLRSPYSTTSFAAYSMNNSPSLSAMAAAAVPPAAPSSIRHTGSAQPGDRRSDTSLMKRFQLSPTATARDQEDTELMDALFPDRVSGYSANYSFVYSLG